jgi:hypothetical protein
MLSSAAAGIPTPESTTRVQRPVFQLRLDDDLAPRSVYLAAFERRFVRCRAAPDRRRDDRILRQPDRIACPGEEEGARRLERSPRRRRG